MKVARENRAFFNFSRSEFFIKVYNLSISSYMTVFLYMMSVASLSGNISFE